MKYIIMADGQGTRWNNYDGIPKHLFLVDGETIIERAIRLFKECDSTSEIIVTSHDKRYEFKDSKRYEPLNNNIEVDRFTYELIEDNICFLYGDTIYNEHTVKQIVKEKVNDVLFFGNENSIVAIKIKKGVLFKKHVDNVKTMFLEGKITKCIGWQVYQSFTNQQINSNKIITNSFIKLNSVYNINIPQDLEKISNN